MNRNLLMFCLLLMVIPLRAQTDIFIEGEFWSLNQFQWSSDSSRLVFYNPRLGDNASVFSNQSSAANWQYIELATGIISEGSYIWPLQPELNSEEASIFITETFIYTSPDENLLIYVQPEIDEMFFDILIANRSTGEIFQTGFSAGYPIPPDTFHVDWSEDGHSVLVAYLRFQGAQRLLHVDIPDFNNLAASTVREFNVIIHNLVYTTTEGNEDKFLDMSSDGQSVLIIGRNLPEFGSFYDSPAELILWHPYRDIAEIVPIQLEVDSYLRAGFSPNNDVLFFLNHEGLYKYWLDNNQLESIPLGFDMNNVLQRHFSPNGEWLALISGREFRLLNLAD